MTTDFKKIKGMSWVLSKKASDLTEEQRVYQKALRAFNYQTRKKKEKGCTEPLYGKKSKCIINIVPQEEKGASLQIDKKCIKTRD